MERIVVLLVWAMLLSGHAFAETVRHLPTGINFPDAIASFTRTGVIDYETQHPGSGFQYTYETSSGGIASVYVYTMGVDFISTDVNHPLNSQIRTLAIKEIHRTAIALDGKANQLGANVFKLSVGGQVIPVMSDEFILDLPENRTTNTQIWHWVARNHFLKIRLTRKPASDFSAKDAYDFLKQVIKLSVW
jgi:hypothetical protein